MSAKLRIARFGQRTGIVQDGVRCGMSWCGAVLGDLVSIAGVQHVSLIEGFRREKTGNYKLHRYAMRNYKLGLCPKDSRPRWTGVHPDGHWGPGPGAVSNPDVPLRERLHTRERVRLDTLQVTCLACGFSNTLRGDTYHIFRRLSSRKSKRLSD